MPSKTISPPTRETFAGKRRNRHEASVDLPEPDSPTTPRIRLRPRSRSMPRRMCALPRVVAASSSRLRIETSGAAALVDVAPAASISTVLADPRVDGVTQRLAEQREAERRDGEREA